MGDDIRVWQEDERPYQRIAEGLRGRGIAAGRVATDEGARFFVFDGIGKLAPKLEYAGAAAVLRQGGVGR